jgi:hypothetical protein
LAFSQAHVVILPRFTPFGGIQGALHLPHNVIKIGSKLAAIEAGNVFQENRRRLKLTNCTEGRWKLISIVAFREVVAAMTKRLARWSARKQPDWLIELRPVHLTHVLVMDFARDPRGFALCVSLECRDTVIVQFKEVVRGESGTCQADCHTAGTREKLYIDEGFLGPDITVRD